VYRKLGEIIANFLGIFETIMVIGFLAKELSSFYLDDILVSLLLKYYY
jgi:hypothetical protein